MLISKKAIKASTKKSPQPKEPKRKVVDAEKPWQIRVTEEDIAKACPKNPEMCVVALAIESMLGPFSVAGFEGMAVGTRITKVYLSGHEIRFATPHELTDSIRVFDQIGEWKLPPREYTLLPLPPSLRLDYEPPPEKKNIKRKLDPNRGTNHRARMSAGRTLNKAGSVPLDYAKRKKVAV